MELTIQRLKNLQFQRFTPLVLVWKSPLWSGLLAFVIYAMLATLNGSIFDASTFPYFNYLAESFLEGKLYLLEPLPATHDLVVFGGQYYAYWPPFPAVLMMPFVAVFGRNFSDIFFTLVVGAINVGLVATLFRVANQKGYIQISALQQSILVWFFAMGTVHITLAPHGQVWFTGQLVGFMCVAIAYITAISLDFKKAPLVTGVAIAAAFLTRNSMVFTGIWTLFILYTRLPEKNWKNTFKVLIQFSFPVLFAVLTTLLYNIARFGNPLDFGLDYHQMAPLFQEQYKKFGAFHWKYLPTNLYYELINYPYPVRPDSLMGGSLFLLSPVFFYAFRAFRKPVSPSVWGLLGSIIFTSIPIFFLMGTGWVQFGPRYTLDFTIPLLLLTARGVKPSSNFLLFLLTIISTSHYITGTIILSMVS